jgi:hypothetical protein
MMDLFFGKLTGVSFQPARDNLIKINKLFPNIDEDQFKIELIHDKENKYDPNAIRVYIVVQFDHGEEKYEVGWIPRFINTSILTHLDKVNVDLVDVIFYQGQVVNLQIRVYIND